MVEPVVRQALDSDAPQLGLLEVEAREGLADRRGGQRWLATNPAREHGWLDQIGLQWVHVAVIDTAVVGYAVASLTGSVVQIREIYVTPDARDVGFGDELLLAIMRRAVFAGASTLEGFTLPGDREMKNLFERAGVKARLIVVSIELNDQ